MKKQFINNFIVVGDLGEVRIYRIKEEITIDPKDNAHTSHKHNRGTLIDKLMLEIVNAADFVDAHKKISDEVTDKEGNYKGPFGSASGEPHNLKLEIENRLLKEIAKFIDNTIKSNDVKKWHLAFPAEHNRALIDRLDYETRDKLDKNLAEDIVKLKENKILEKFGI